MSGLSRIAKMYGAMTIDGKRYVWDYSQDKAVPETEMPSGSERHKASERAKWAGAEAHNAVAQAQAAKQTVACSGLLGDDA